MILTARAYSALVTFINSNFLTSGSQPFLARGTLKSEKNLAAHLRQENIFKPKN